MADKEEEEEEEEEEMGEGTKGENNICVIPGFLTQLVRGSTWEVT